MKKIISIILLAIFTFPFLAQAQVLDQKKALYEKKILSFTKMKQTGVGLTFGGVVLTIAGVALMVDGANNYVDNDNYSSTDDLPAKFYLGYLTAIVGGAATTGGIVLWSIGGSKSRRYKQGLKSLSLNLKPAHNQIFSLAYRF